MNRRNFLKAGIAVGIGLTLPKGVYAKLPPPPRTETPPYLLERKVTGEDRAAAAARAKEMGFGPGQVDRNLVPDIPGMPHYFGPYPNYANSPMPTAPVASVALVSGGSGYTTPTVSITDIYNTQTVLATAHVVVTGGVVTDIVLDTAGAGYTAPIVTITDSIGSNGVGAAATAALDTTQLTGGIRKFVDGLAGLTAAAASSTLHSFIPLAVPDQGAYPGNPVDPFDHTNPACDYYEIGLVQYRHKFHTDLDPTLVRGYVQISTTAVPGDHVELFNEMPNGTQVTTGYFGVTSPQYLGPAILSAKDRPVRILFRNLLPTGQGGDLFIPVDETLMGAGKGPTGANYTDNRATLHNHGALSPWISDGTPHQWTVPAGENTPYKIGDSAVNVPDMPNPGDGSLTFYYTNQQSARLMFYHDHAFGITRLNVYVGEAAPYLITDDFEADLIAGTNATGVNTGLFQLPQDAYGYGIPLVLQDKTFVDAKTIAAQDPNWLDEGARRGWGSNPGTGVTGDLWVPNVYMPAQNPWDPSGASAFGRWQYGPWFWPPTAGIDFGPTDNPYYSPSDNPWEPPMIPTMPNPSMGMEAFNDTTLVNGVVYPYLEVEPRTYRFRILNAANDRFFNLHFYEADPNQVMSWAGQTEMQMVPAGPTPGFPATWPVDGRPSGVPDPASMGPSWIQIGTEGGFLPTPVVVPPQPVNWNMNQTAFNFGNVTDHSLLVGCAERADVLVDFSQHAGKTLILFNDAPAAFPAIDSRYDYFTGSPDQTDTGGAPTTQPGYGPNTRTVMQIRVGQVGGVAQGLDNIKVTAGGSDYGFAPEVVFTGGGASSDAIAQAYTSIDHITVLTAGSNYTAIPDVVVTGDGINAAATAVLSGGRVTGIIVTNIGSGYTTAPTVTITPAAGDVTGAGATAVALMMVTAIALTDPGVGYTSLPTVSLVGGGGYGAAAVAGFALGTAFDMAGLEAVFAHAPGKPGLFEASQDPILLPQAAYNTALGTTLTEAQSQYIQLYDFTKNFFNGPLTGLNLTAGGTGYTSAPTVTIGAGGTTDATATAAITGAFVNAITLLTKGAGYTSNPTVTITAASGDTGVGATATAATSRVVKSVTINNGGTAYTSAPNVRFNGGGGSGATATATVSGGRITAITVTNGGSYTGTPTISFQGGGGR